VHRHGRLTLAKVLSASRLRALLATAPHSSGTTIGRRTHQPKTCLIVYRDSYSAGEIAAARASAGRYAILLIRVRHPLLIAALVRDRLPPTATH
jgi:hypothetical protein